MDDSLSVNTRLPTLMELLLSSTMVAFNSTFVPALEMTVLLFNTQIVVEDLIWPFTLSITFPKLFSLRYNVPSFNTDTPLASAVVLTLVK